MIAFPTISHMPRWARVAATRLHLWAKVDGCATEDFDQHIPRVASVCRGMGFIKVAPAAADSEASSVPAISLLDT